MAGWKQGGSQYRNISGAPVIDSGYTGIYADLNGELKWLGSTEELILHTANASASYIFVDNTPTDFVSTDVQGVIEEIDAEFDIINTDILNLSAAIDDLSASDIFLDTSTTPFITGDNVQQGIEQLEDLIIGISGEGLQIAYQFGNEIDLSPTYGDFIIRDQSGNEFLIDQNGELYQDGTAFFNEDLEVVNAFQIYQDSLHPGISGAGINDDRIYLYNTANIIGPNELVPTTSPVSYTNRIFLDTIDIRQVQDFDTHHNGRVLYTGRVPNVPTEGSNAFYDFEVYNDNRGRLRFDSLTYPTNPDDRSTAREYQNLLTLIGAQTAPTSGRLDLEDILGPFGGRLYSSNYYRDWEVNSTFINVFDEDTLRVDPLDSPFAVGLYNAGVRGDAESRGVGVYMTGTGNYVDVKVKINVPQSGEFYLDCDVIGAWHRFNSSTPRWSALRFTIDDNPIYGEGFGVVDNSGVTQDRTWFNPEIVLADPAMSGSNYSHVNQTFTGIPPGEHTLWISYNSFNAFGVTPPAGMNISNHKNVNIAFFNLVTNSLYDDFLIITDPNDAGVVAENLYIPSLTTMSVDTSGSNLLSWSGEFGRVIDSGVGIEDITGSIDDLQSQIDSLSGGDASADFVNITGDTMTGPLVLPTSTVANPGLQIGDSNVGIYRVADSLRLKADGLLKAQVNGSFTLNTDLRLQSGDSTNLSARIVGDLDTGFYGDGAGKLATVVDGQEKIISTATQTFINDEVYVESLSGFGTGLVGIDNTGLISYFDDSIFATQTDISALQVQIDDISGSTASATATSASVEVIDTTTAEVAEWLVSVKNGTNIRASKIVAANDGTTAESNEYSTSDLGNTSAVTLDVDYSGGEMRLIATITGTDDWTIKAKKEEI